MDRWIRFRVFQWHDYWDVPCWRCKKQGSQHRTGFGLLPMIIRFDEQELQYSLPHRLQWCLLRVNVNGFAQSGSITTIGISSSTHLQQRKDLLVHSNTASSGVHADSYADDDPKQFQLFKPVGLVVNFLRDSLGLKPLFNFFNSALSSLLLCLSQRIELC